MKLSAVIIARNEEEMIGGCIDSVSFADEILVLENGSMDKTAEVAKKKGAKVVTAKTQGYSNLRNEAAKLAKGEWLLYIDADERVPAKLREEIKREVLESSYAALAMPRKNNLLGHDMSYGGWWPDYVLRLIKKEALVEYEGDLHEQPKIKGEVGELKNYLYHITHRNLESMVQKTNEYSDVEARLMLEAGHPKMTIPRFFSAMCREFWHRAIAKLGFLDGPIGMIEVGYQVFNKFVIYAKLWELQQKKYAK